MHTPGSLNSEDFDPQIHTVTPPLVCGMCVQDQVLAEATHADDANTDSCICPECICPDHQERS